MKIITEISRPIDINNPVITIGTFDGIHIGHRAIFKQLVEVAASKGCDSAVVTFNPHPRIVLGQEVMLINTPEEKRNFIEDLGISHLIEIPFTLEFADLDANEFIKLLADLLKPSVVIIGYDHGFGKNRSGDVHLLEQAGKAYGFKVINVPAIEAEGYKVSSSVIRNLLEQGDVKMASALLGQYYEITGTVIRGNQIGKRIGYPTANLYLENTHKLIPGMGVYASVVQYKNQSLQGMTNIGLRPTINAHQLTIETNIFDFETDIYYEKLTIKLVDRIRDEKRFDSLNSLRHQLQQDQQTTKQIFQSRQM